MFHMTSQKNHPVAGHPNFHYLPSKLLHHQAGDRSNLKRLYSKKIGSGILRRSAMLVVRTGAGALYILVILLCTGAGGLFWCFWSVVVLVVCTGAGGLY